MKDLKLFVWKDVFCDYTCGIAFALAETADEARQLILVKHPYPEYAQRQLEKKPKVYTKKYGHFIWGGG